MAGVAAAGAGDVEASFPPPVAEEEPTSAPDVPSPAQQARVPPMLHPEALVVPSAPELALEPEPEPGPGPEPEPEMGQEPEPEPEKEPEAAAAVKSSPDRFRQRIRTGSASSASEPEEMSTEPPRDPCPQKTVSGTKGTQL